MLTNLFRAFVVFVESLVAAILCSFCFPALIRLLTLEFPDDSRLSVVGTFSLLVFATQLFALLMALDEQFL